PEISIPFSLTFIVLVLAVTTITSLRASKKQEAAGAGQAV
ncbi:TerC family protein, partial [Streptomyces caelestis]